MSGYLLVNTKKNRVENIVSWDGDTEMNWGDNLIAIPQSKDKIYDIGSEYTEHIEVPVIEEKPANRNTEPENLQKFEVPKALHAAGEEPEGTVFVLMDSNGNTIAQQTVRPISTNEVPEGLFWVVFDPSGKTYPLE